MESEGLEYHQTSSKQHQEFIITFQNTEANLPHNYHFGAVMNEMIKQVSH